MIAEHRLDWEPRHPTDLRLTVGGLRRGPGDPAYATGPDGSIWRATRMPEGVATVRLRRIDERMLRAEAWGPGAAAAVAQAPELCGDGDDPGAFEPLLPVLRDAHRRFEGLRVPRSARVFEALAPAILEQKVITLQAHESWRRLLHRFGEVAPGPTPRPMRVPPAAATWAVIPVWEWHRAGVDPRRAGTIVTAAKFADRIEEAARMPPAEATARLTHFPGIGAWTAAEVAQRAFGDADAVSVGDYHLSNFVGHALEGRDMTDDEMLVALEPWAGQRYRVIRLLGHAGVRGRPSRGPRMPFVDHAWH
ncbi:DNA-3-methyladenine glycosylase [Agromyces sp. LHK192]|uniref:DNA-3-methyladenine glycosylase family protein n=1 Tax=Agromyces sp. LHK192 TaxID=2498704 RepID=UPI000FD9FD4F|nr:DNA-3-methyladenine glycosylase [Agromyces sp. LHK192]